VDWNGEASQRVRFNALSKLIPELAASAFSVDDYGCGYGAYLDYLHERGFERLDYLGLDISQEMVDEARRLHPHGAFEVAAGALGSPIMPWPAGFLMWCRIRNAPRGAAHCGYAGCDAYCHEARLCFQLPDYVFRCGLLRPHLYYGDPCFFFDHCKRRYSRQVALLHDYGLYEFTIIVRKDI